MKSSSRPPTTERTQESRQQQGPAAQSVDSDKQPPTATRRRQQRFSQGVPTDTRGQFIIAGAFIVVLALIVALAAANITLTTAVEQEAQLSDRSDELVEMTHTLERSGESTLQRVNHDPGISDQSTRRFEASTETTEVLNTHVRSFQRSIDGGTVTVENTQTTNGYRVTQPTESTLTNGSGGSDWTVVAGASQTRQFTLTLDPREFSDASRPDQLIVEVDGEQVTIEQASGSSTAVDVTVNGETTTVETGPQATIDFLAGTVDAQAIAGYPSVTVTDVIIRNGNSTTGTFGLVYEGTAAQTPDAPDQTAPPGSSTTPVGHQVVYALEYELRVATPTGTLVSTVEIAPKSKAGPA